ncbi:MAG TPA: hypothetical protein VGS97_19945 [Actinocrinis sp.]|uniref:hypothetical protein n=1 Tax=Actinocrinis sp. TaxID=1920516 RepID=UPI002DDD8611|nr:hypothetical protein [Actinocrinis sp.]HEV2346381.1 hypothetical protein [Actinocrinis sp.]
MSKPFILGQRVLYTVTADEAEAANERRQTAVLHKQLDDGTHTAQVLRIGNTVYKGQQYPADVVAVFDRQYANLQVHLDGNDQLWTTSRCWGDGEGFCQETSF